MYSSTINAADRSVPSAPAGSAALNPARAAEVRGEVITQAVRRVMTNLRRDADLPDEATLASAARQTLSHLFDAARDERDHHAPRGGLTFSAACDRLVVLGSSDSTERARLIAPVVGQIKQQHAERVRTERMQHAAEHFRQIRLGQEADRLEALADDLRAAAAERRLGRVVSMTVGKVVAALTTVQRGL
jgi:hypothetical protein